MSIGEGGARKAAPLNSRPRKYRGQSEMRSPTTSGLAPAHRTSSADRRSVQPEVPAVGLVALARSDGSQVRPGVHGPMRRSLPQAGSHASSALLSPGPQACGALLSDASAVRTEFDSPILWLH